ncbi:MAG: CoA-binding protein [Ignavibacteria bacterium]|nr:CoA-binding protein [Ignavibacteria bacterium]
MELEKGKELLKKFNTIAVYGFSKNPEKVAHWIPVYLKNRNYKIIGINPQNFVVPGIPVYQKLSDIPDEIHILNVFRPSEVCVDILNEAVERKKERGDIFAVWLQEGITNEEARKIAEGNQIAFLQDTCIYKVYQELNR